MTGQPKTLSPEHQTMLADSGIAPEVAARRGYWTATTKQEIGILGFSLAQRLPPALMLPLFGPDGRLAGYQERPDVPRQDKNGKHIKYETARGAALVPDVSPAVLRDHVADPSLPLLVTEGVKKGDALASIDLAAVALVGVTGWRGRNAFGGKTALAAWQQIALNGRVAYLCFDSDVAANPAVDGQLRKLKAYLEYLGARVRIIYLPHGPGRRKVGVDDYLVHLTQHPDCPRVPVVDPNTDPETQRQARIAQPIVERKRKEWLQDQLLALAEDSLRPLPASVNTANDPNAAGPYRINEHGTFWLKPVGDDTQRVQLANFAARIEAQNNDDDGADERRTYDLQAILNGRTSRFSVPASQFGGLNWVSQHLGAAAIVRPGQSIREHLRTAIQEFSGDVPTHIRYAHTGWREIDGAWYYLSASGAIGPNGLVSDLAARLPSALTRYTLPTPPEGDDLARVVGQSLWRIDVAPDRITVPAAGMSYRAVLGEVDLSGHLEGPSGAGKTALAALMQSDFGPGFDRHHLPGNWDSTGNALVRQAFLLKDALFVVDDFAPNGSRRRDDRLHDDAERLLRSAGNRAGRDRMNADGTLRAGTWPRALVLSSGEEVPRGRSLRARLCILEVGADDITMEHLLDCQRDAASGVYASAMAGFLRWLAPQYGTIRAGLLTEVEELRAQAAGFGQHRRTPEITANLAIGWRYFLRFAVAVGALTVDEHDRWWARIWTALLATASRQPAHYDAADPARRYLELLAAAIASGSAHVAAFNGQEPCTPERWGWRQRMIGTGDYERSEWQPQGQRVGWVDDTESDLYLEPTTSYATAQRLAQTAGDGLSVGQHTLHRRLKDAGLLKTTDEGRRKLTVRKVVGGNRLNLLHIAAGALTSPDAAQSAHADHPASEGALVSTSGPENGPIRWADFAASPSESAHQIGPQPAHAEHGPSANGASGPNGPVSGADRPAQQGAAATEVVLDPAEAIRQLDESGWLAQYGGPKVEVEGMVFTTGFIKQKAGRDLPEWLADSDQKKRQRAAGLIACLVQYAAHGAPPAG